MNKEEIIQGNIIIADFIQLKRDGNKWLFNNQWYGIDDLLFNKSWDWIFYALDKVQELIRFGLVLLSLLYGIKKIM